MIARLTKDCWVLVALTIANIVVWGPLINEFEIFLDIRVAIVRFPGVANREQVVSQ